MRVLVICDDYYHPANVVRAGLDLVTGYSFDYIEDAGDWSAAKMAPYPVVLYAKSNNVSAANREPWITPEVEQALADYVRAGHGMLAIHSGTVVKEQAVLRALVGGTFDHHPKQCPVTVRARGGAPADRGRRGLHGHRRALSHDHGRSGPWTLFLTTISEHSKQPGGWTRTEGAGRVSVLTPGPHGGGLHPAVVLAAVHQLPRLVRGAELSRGTIIAPRTAVSTWGAPSEDRNMEPYGTGDGRRPRPGAGAHVRPAGRRLARASPGSTWPTGPSWNA